MKSLRTINELDLEQVTGGQAPAGGATKTTSSGSSDDAVLKALHGIQASLADIGKKNQGLFGGTNGLLFMTMALAFSRHAQMSVSGGSNGLSYSWKSSW
jgi:hypothetical protein